MKLQTQLELAHINIRREMEGEDEGPVATDLKLVGKVAAEKLAELFSTPAGFDFALGSLYRDDGELVTHDVASMVLAREGLGVIVSLTGGLGSRQLRFEGVDVNRIRLTPAPGRQVELTMRLQLHPRVAELGTLTEWLGRFVEIDLQAAQTELSLPPGIEPANEATQARVPRRIRAAAA